MVIGLLGAALLAAVTGTEPSASRAGWMSGKYGMMVHWLYPKYDAKDPGQVDRTVDAFDLDTFMKGFDETGAEWLVFTVGQNTGACASPSKTLEALETDGARMRGRCSRRDLVGEIAAAVHRRGKRFIAYLPCEVFWNAGVREAVGWSSNDVNYVTFQRNWTAVVREWAERWGRNLDGWWFDGFYGFYEPDEDLWRSAIRAGNPDAVSAFNAGVVRAWRGSDKRRPGQRYRSSAPTTRTLEDYLAGEVNLIERGRIRMNEHRWVDDASRPELWIPETACVPGTACLNHVLLPIDGWWAAYSPWGFWLDAEFAKSRPEVFDEDWMAKMRKDGKFFEPVFSRDNLARFVRDLTKVGAAVTLNIGVGPTGELNPFSVARLRDLKTDMAALKDLPSEAIPVVRGLGVGDVRIACEKPGAWTFATSTARIGDGVEELTVELSAPEASAPPAFTVSFDVPQLDAHHRWTSHPDRTMVPPNWNCRLSSRLCSELPLVSFLSDTDENRILVAASEAKRSVDIEAGVREENNTLVWKLSFFGEPEAPIGSYRLKIRFDTRHVFFGDAVREGVAWIEKAGGLVIPEPPEAAFDPLYSAWYSFHQNLKDTEVEQECEKAAELGLKALIVDDGWQTDDSNRGYSFTGDWEISKRRFPDMAGHVRKVHEMGLKYLVWYGVPMVGVKSRNFERFKGKYLWIQERKGSSYGCLDPRFPEVRRHLCDLYEKAVREWDIDGLKLDFIDAMCFRGEDPALAEDFAGRDIKALPEAVDTLLREVHARLNALKPGFLFEFRQSYIGPAIRQYGNMLRAGDCPGDLQLNRCRTANLRLSSGKTPVHADMLEWNYANDAETAARYVLATMFSVIQYSVMLRTCPDDHKRMIRHWLGFSQAHRETLLKSAFRPHGFGANYPWMEAESAAERIVGVYAGGQVIPVDAAKPTYVLNATATDCVYLEAAADCTAEIFDTFGTPVGTVKLAKGLNKVSLPLSGYLKTKERTEEVH